jgi:hypothetical protein
MKIVLALVLAAVLAGCGSQPGSSDSGIRGFAGISRCGMPFSGGTCLDPIPYSGDLEVRDLKGKAVETLHTDAKGNFEVQLDPGSYVIERGGLPSLKPVTVQVKPGAFTDVQLRLDSGIV